MLNELSTSLHLIANHYIPRWSEIEKMKAAFAVDHRVSDGAEAAQLGKCRRHFWKIISGSWYS